MNTSNPSPNQPSLNTSQDGILEISHFPTGTAKNRFGSHFVNIDRRFPSNTVFHIDDNTFTSSLPRASHWSIAWSDLMMTMFILFLSMYVYKAANQEFLLNKTPEIIGGDTTEALQSIDSGGSTFPFAPIHPGLPLISGGTVKKVEPVEIESLDPDAVFSAGQREPLDPKKVTDEKELLPSMSTSGPEQVDPFNKTAEDPPAAKESPSVTQPDTILQPNPINPDRPQPVTNDNFQEIYALSQVALRDNNLDKFAAIDIVPDKTMRIILTGDLLFSLGDSALSRKAKGSLQKIAEVIRHTPYMINVVGHTDNLPMRSNRFSSNWELSVARASTVARFLIDTMGMNPNQFVVSGYSSYRPIKPNNNSENRAKNRRVEIIVSKRLPNPVQPTPQNLN